MRQSGIAIQPFKKGPDYIDPMWLSKAANRPCHNLDFYTMQRQEILETFTRYSQGADIAIIEGNKGLYDGLDLDGSNSNAALATLLKAPVVLVIDARGMTRGIAPLILGYQAFDPEIQIAGVILNNLGGRRHESKLRAVIEHYTDVQVLGSILKDSRLEIVERHLGLMPSNETGQAEAKINSIAEIITDQVDLDRIRTIASNTPFPAYRLPPAQKNCEVDVRIGIAKDAAFGFYYPGDIEALRASGAELIKINCLTDSKLPEIDGLFIGGGFPETQMAALEANNSLRSAIRNAIENGLPVYAECGGLMYLARSITWHKGTHDMVGVIPGNVVMHDAPQGRGYVRLRDTGKNPWPKNDRHEKTTTDFAAHEFHYSSLENLDHTLHFAYEVTRGSGIDGKHDGIVYKNLLANYAHLRDVADNHWTTRFVEFVRSKKSRQYLDASATSG
jgi:cobyrinic acid a,c-diamide synthase